MSGQQSAGGLPSGRRFGRRPNLGNSGLNCLGEVQSNACGWVSYDFAFLSYVFGVVSYGL